MAPLLAQRPRHGEMPQSTGRQAPATAQYPAIQTEIPEVRGVSFLIWRDTGQRCFGIAVLSPAPGGRLDPDLLLPAVVRP